MSGKESETSNFGKFQKNKFLSYPGQEFNFGGKHEVGLATKFWISMQGRL